LNFDKTGLMNTTFQDNTGLATNAVAFKAAVEADLSQLVGQSGYPSDGWTYVWITTDWSADYMDRPVTIEIPNNDNGDDSENAFQTYNIDTYRWNNQYYMLMAGTTGALTASSMTPGNVIKYVCDDGTIGDVNTCADQCDNNNLMAFEVMKFIKSLSSQTFTRTYSASSRIGYCQIYIVVDGDVADTWATTHGLVYTTGQSTLPELVAFYDPSAAGQLNTDGSYTGGALPDYDPTGGSSSTSTGIGFSSAAVNHQPIALLLAMVPLVLALFF